MNYLYNIKNIFGLVDALTDLADAEAGEVVPVLVQPSLILRRLDVPGRLQVRRLDAETAGVAGARVVARLAPRHATLTSQQNSQMCNNRSLSDCA